MRDLIFISLEAWDDVWRRNQFVCAELARRHPDRTVLFVTPPRDLTNAIRRRQFARLRPAPPWSPAGLPNVVVFTPTKWLPNSLAVGRWFNGRTLGRQVAAEARRRRFDRPALWINDHAAAGLTVGESTVVYDVTDDWISFDQPTALRARTRRQDAALCRRADAVIVCSERLMELKRPLVPGGRLHLIPNGVDAAPYATVRDRSAGPLPAGAERWPRPVLGYVGTVHPDRVDVPLLVAVAERVRGRGSVVLVGPDHLPAADAKRLDDTGAVFRVGAVRYADVPDYLRAFDVNVVPHRVTPFTESLNPIKLFEYLAAGKPIVSTPVAGFRDFPQWVALAGDADAFVAAALASLAEPAAVAAGRQAEAGRHSWAARVDAVEAVLDGPAPVAKLALVS